MNKFTHLFEKDIIINFNWINLVLFLQQYVLKPTFTEKEISVLDINDKLSRAYDGTTYMPGMDFSFIASFNLYNYLYFILFKLFFSVLVFSIILFFVLTGIVGLNNIKANDYCNVILQVCLIYQLI